MLSAGARSAIICRYEGGSLLLVHILARLPMGGLLLAALAGCNTPPETPVSHDIFDAEYSHLSACSYAELERQHPTFVKITDLRGINAARVTFESETGGLLGSSTHRLWDITFTKISYRRTKVEIRAMGTIYGSDFYAQKVLPVIRACAAQRPATLTPRKKHDNLPV